MKAIKLLLAVLAMSATMYSCNPNADEDLQEKISEGIEKFDGAEVMALDLAERTAPGK